MLSVSSDPKTIKGEKRGYLTGILYLAPHTLSGRNLCPNATPGCITTCLNTAGLGGVYPAIQRARIVKSQAFTRNPSFFVDSLVKEITSLCKKAAKRGLIPVVRLNGTSDLPWERLKTTKGLSLMETFPQLQFYDYSKSPERMVSFQTAPWWPQNYRLTFSRSENNDLVSQSVLELGGSVAVVFSTKRGQALPATWYGYPVEDGDTTDLRFKDASGVVIGLRAKGRARKDTSGFVVQV